MNAALPAAASLRTARAIAAATVMEAVRGRLLWVVGAIALAAWALGGFLGQVALTEGRETQAALLAAFLRLASALLVATLTVAATVREAQDKQADMLLALPVPRAAWLLGRMAGFATVAALPALAAALLAACVSPAGQAALWGASLLCELWLVAAFALFCALSLGHTLQALGATVGFYLLARSAWALQLLAHARPPGERGFAGVAADAIAFLLPQLDACTRAEWLLYGTGTVADLWAVLAQTAIYLALVMTAALFDLVRKEF